MAFSNDNKSLESKHLYTILRQIVIMPRHITTIALGIIFGLIIHLYLLSSEGFTYVEMNSLGIVECMLLGIIISYVIMVISSKLNGWITWQNNATSRLITGIIINATIAYIILCIFYKFNWNNLAHSTIGAANFGQVGMIKLGIIVSVSVIIFSVIYYALFSYNLFASAQIHETQFQRELLEAQMTTLKSQLTPHFLFNSLNTISSLIHRDNNEAETFIRKLAKTYHYALHNYNKNWVNLAEEMEVVDSYFFMMKTRFGQGIQIKVNIPDTNRETKVLPLSIQCLIENAIKHNIIDSLHPLNIKIAVSDQGIVVSNNKTGTPSKVISHNVGLSNLKRRYSLLTGKLIRIIDSDDFFTVIIPGN